MKKTRLESASAGSHVDNALSVATNSRLSSIEEKLNLLLTVLPELESYKSSINQLEEENKSLQRSLQFAHAEIEDLQAKADVTESQQQKINDNQG